MSTPLNRLLLPISALEGVIVALLLNYIVPGTGGSKCRLELCTLYECCFLLSHYLCKYTVRCMCCTTGIMRCALYRCTAQKTKNKWPIAKNPTVDLLYRPLPRSRGNNNVIVLQQLQQYRNPLDKAPVLKAQQILYARIGSECSIFRQKKTKIGKLQAR